MSLTNCEQKNLAKLIHKSFLNLSELREEKFYWNLYFACSGWITGAKRAIVSKFEEKETFNSLVSNYTKHLNKLKVVKTIYKITLPNGIVDAKECSSPKWKDLKKRALKHVKQKSIRHVLKHIKSLQEKTFHTMHGEKQAKREEKKKRRASFQKWLKK